MRLSNFLLTVSISTFMIAAPAVADIEPDSLENAEVIERPTNVFLAVNSTDGRFPKVGFMHNLDLTDEQMQNMVALRDRLQIATAAKGAEIKSLMHEIASQLSQPSIDKKAVNELHDKSTKLHAELSNEHHKFMTDTAEILTPEQRKKLYNGMLRHQVGPGPMPFGPMGGPPPMMGHQFGMGFPPPMMGHAFGMGFPPPMMGHPSGMGFPPPMPHSPDMGGSQ
ncbi:MAG: Spy/CpxP family protein refolding chaperone [Candidatus Melainabacteria bacterium]|nr:Spy/CpxP family protein refolding chaperone [Candidatus Melainabacteria bacterium]